MALLLAVGSLDVVAAAFLGGRPRHRGGGRGSTLPENNPYWSDPTLHFGSIVHIF
jgi:hypothetical protein